MKNPLKFFILIIVSSGCASGIPARGTPLRVAMSSNGIEIREIPLERYVAGVVSKEAISDWPLEALKAQAIASRTYALYRKAHPRDERYDLVADTSDQLFEGKRRYPAPITMAVQETEGEVMKYGGEIFSAFFHSCCGGISERGDLVWEGVETPPLLNTREDPYCSACPRAHWEYQISEDDLASRLAEKGYSAEKEGSLEITKRDDSGRVVEVTFFSTPPKKREFFLPGTLFREILGYENIRSTLFEINPDLDDSETIHFSGRGSGHGVGLCQWGAKGMADEGKNYREILEFYYPGAEITVPGENPLPETMPIGTE